MLFRSHYIAIFFAELFIPLLIVFIIRSFIGESFRVPSSSMRPTLIEGDLIIANKYTYGLRIPYINKVIWPKDANAQLKRGDVVVFRFPSDSKIYYVKRLIGLPGDTIEYNNHELKINGKIIKNTAVQNTAATSHKYQRLIEYHLTNGDERNYSIQINEQDMTNTRPFRTTVEEGKYFVMGDNRDNSYDSRFWGTVPAHLVVGKAVFIWMNLNCLKFDSAACKRIGTKIK